MRFLTLAFFATTLLAGGALTSQADAKEKTAVTVKAKSSQPTSSGKVAGIARDPFIGMIVVDGATGQTLAEQNADAMVYPASVIKLMNIFVVLDSIQQGTVHLTDKIEVSAEVSHMGGSRVYLKEHEVFTVEEMLYALMVQSANDCALALAQHVGGSQAAFVQLMNQKAQSLGMTNTHFYSCHGEPPTPPRKPDEVDVSTARELAILGRALVAAHPEVLQYTSTKKRTFREKPLFVMENHNHLLGVVPGVDGLKTGWFRAAGYSLVATAERSGRRIFVVVAGSDGALGKVRDKAATEQITRAFANLPALPPPPPPKPTNVVVAAVEPPTNVAAVAEEPPVEKKAENPWWKKPFVMYTGIGVLAVIGVLIGTLVIRARKQTGASYAMDALPPDIRRK